MVSRGWRRRVNPSAMMMPSGSGDITPPDYDLSTIGFYKLGKTLGSGRYGKVKLARHILTGEYVAIKMIQKKYFDSSSLKRVQREVDILKRLHHPNLLKLYEVIETPLILWIVTEYCHGGEMIQYISDHNAMNEDTVKRHFRSLVQVVHYCHSSGVIHRDLKPENMLLTASGELRLADFGLANIVTPLNPTLSTSCGSPHYAAPEIFLGLPYDGKRLDMWSLGIILYVMLTGMLPFNHESPKELRDYVVSANFVLPESLPVGAADVITSLLRPRPIDRLDSSALLRHEWLINGMTEDVNTATCELENGSGNHSVAKLIASDVESIEADFMSSFYKSLSLSTYEHQVIIDEMSRFGISFDRLEMAIREDPYDAISAIYCTFAARSLRERIGVSEENNMADLIEIHPSILNESINTLRPRSAARQQVSLSLSCLPRKQLSPQPLSPTAVRAAAEAVSALANRSESAAVASTPSLVDPSRLITKSNTCNGREDDRCNNSNTSTVTSMASMWEDSKRTRSRDNGDNPIFGTQRVRRIARSNDYIFQRKDDTDSSTRRSLKEPTQVLKVEEHSDNKVNLLSPTPNMTSDQSVSLLWRRHSSTTEYEPSVMQKIERRNPKFKAFRTVLAVKANRTANEASNNNESHHIEKQPETENVNNIRLVSSIDRASSVARSQESTHSSDDDDSSRVCDHVVRSKAHVDICHDFCTMANRHYKCSISESEDNSSNTLEMSPKVEADVGDIVEFRSRTRSNTFSD